MNKRAVINALTGTYALPTSDIESALDIPSLSALISDVRRLSHGVDEADMAPTLLAHTRTAAAAPAHIAWDIMQDLREQEESLLLLQTIFLVARADSSIDAARRAAHELQSRGLVEVVLETLTVIAEEESRQKPPPLGSPQLPHLRAQACYRHVRKTMLLELFFAVFWCAGYDCAPDTLLRLLSVIGDLRHKPSPAARNLLKEGVRHPLVSDKLVDCMVHWCALCVLECLSLSSVTAPHAEELAADASLLRRHPLMDDGGFYINDSLHAEMSRQVADSMRGELEREEERTRSEHGMWGHGGGHGGGAGGADAGDDEAAEELLQERLFARVFQLASGNLAAPMVVGYSALLGLCGAWRRSAAAAAAILQQEPRGPPADPELLAAQRAKAAPPTEECRKQAFWNAEGFAQFLPVGLAASVRSPDGARAAGAVETAMGLPAAAVYLERALADLSFYVPTPKTFAESVGAHGGVLPLPAHAEAHALAESRRMDTAAQQLEEELSMLADGPGRLAAIENFIGDLQRHSRRGGSSYLSFDSQGSTAATHSSTALLATAAADTLPATATTELDDLQYSHKPLVDAAKHVVREFLTGVLRARREAGCMVTVAPWSVQPDELSTLVRLMARIYRGNARACEDFWQRASEGRERLLDVVEAAKQRYPIALEPLCSLAQSLSATPAATQAMVEHLSRTMTTFTTATAAKDTPEARSAWVLLRESHDHVAAMRPPRPGARDADLEPATAGLLASVLDQRPRQLLAPIVSPAEGVRIPVTSGSGAAATTTLGRAVRLGVPNPNFPSGMCDYVVWLHRHSAWPVLLSRLRHVAAHIAHPTSARNVELVRGALETGRCSVSQDEFGAAFTDVDGVARAVSSICGVLAAAAAQDPGFPERATREMRGGERQDAMEHHTGVLVRGLLQVATALLHTLLPLIAAANAATASLPMSAPPPPQDLLILEDDVRNAAYAAAKLISALTVLHPHASASALIPAAGAREPRAIAIFRGLIDRNDRVAGAYVYSLPLIRAVDAMLAHVLRRRACLDLSPVFRKFDVDGSGQIDRAEFVQGLSSLGYKLSEAALDTLLADLDEDNSGTIEYGEFARYVLEQARIARVEAEPGASSAATASATGTGGAGAGGGGGGGSAVSTDGVRTELRWFILSLTETTPAETAAEAVLLSSVASTCRELLPSVLSWPCAHLASRTVLIIRTLRMLLRLLDARISLDGDTKADPATAPTATATVRDALATAILNDSACWQAIRTIAFTYPVLAEMRRSVGGGGGGGSGGGGPHNIPAVALPADFDAARSTLSISDATLVETASLYALQVMQELLHFVPSTAVTTVTTTTTVTGAGAGAGADPADWEARKKADIMLNPFSPHIHPVQALLALAGYEKDAFVRPLPSAAPPAAWVATSKYVAGDHGVGTRAHFAPPAIRTTALSILHILARCMSTVIRGLDATAVGYGQQVVAYSLTTYMLYDAQQAAAVRQLLLGAGTPAGKKVDDAVLLHSLRLLRTSIECQGGFASVLCHTDPPQLANLATAAAAAAAPAKSTSIDAPSALHALADILRLGPALLSSRGRDRDASSGAVALGPELVLEACRVFLAIMRSACETGAFAREYTTLTNVPDVWKLLIALLDHQLYDASAAAAALDARGSPALPTSIAAATAVADASLGILSNDADAAAVAVAEGLQVHALHRHATLLNVRAVVLDIAAAQLRWHGATNAPFIDAMRGAALQESDSVVARVVQSIAGRTPARALQAHELSRYLPHLLRTGTHVDFGESHLTHQVARIAAADAGLKLSQYAALPDACYPTRAASGPVAVLTALAEGGDANTPITTLQRIAELPAGHGAGYAVDSVAVAVGIPRKWAYALCAAPLRTAATAAALGEAGAGGDEDDDDDGMGGGGGPAAQQLDTDAHHAITATQRVRVRTCITLLWAAAAYSASAALVRAQLAQVQAVQAVLAAACSVPLPGAGATGELMVSRQNALNTAYLMLSRLQQNCVVSQQPVPASAAAAAAAAAPGAPGQAVTATGGPVLDLAWLSSATVLADAASTLLGKALDVEKPNGKPNGKPASRAAGGAGGAGAAPAAATAATAAAPAGINMADRHVRIAVRGSVEAICVALMHLDAHVPRAAASSSSSSSPDPALRQSSLSLRTTLVASALLLCNRIPQEAGDAMAPLSELCNRALAAMQAATGAAASAADDDVDALTAVAGLYSIAASLLMRVLQLDKDNMLATSAILSPQWMQATARMCKGVFALSCSRIAARLAAHETAWGTLIQGRIRAARAGQPLDLHKHVTKDKAQLSATDAAHIAALTSLAQASLRLCSQLAAGAELDGAIAVAAAGMPQAIAASPLIAHAEAITKQRIEADLEVYDFGVGPDAAIVQPRRSLPQPAAAAAAAPPAAASPTSPLELLKALKALGVGRAEEIAFAAAGWGWGPGVARGYGADSSRSALHTCWCDMLALMTVMMRVSPTVPDAATALALNRAAAVDCVTAAPSLLHTALTHRTYTFALCCEATAAASFCAGLYNAAALSPPTAGVLVGIPPHETQALLRPVLDRWIAKVGGMGTPAAPTQPSVLAFVSAYALRDATLMLGRRDMPADESLAMPAPLSLGPSATASASGSYPNLSTPSGSLGSPPPNPHLHRSTSGRDVAETGARAVEAPPGERARTTMARVCGWQFRVVSDAEQAVKAATEHDEDLIEEPTTATTAATTGARGPALIPARAFTHRSMDEEEAEEGSAAEEEDAVLIDLTGAPAAAVPRNLHVRMSRWVDHVDAAIGHVLVAVTALSAAAAAVPTARAAAEAAAAAAAAAKAAAEQASRRANTMATSGLWDPQLSAANALLADQSLHGGAPGYGYAPAASASASPFASSQTQTQSASVPVANAGYRYGPSHSHSGGADGDGDGDATILGAGSYGSPNLQRPLFAATPAPGRAHSPRPMTAPSLMSATSANSALSPSLSHGGGGMGGMGGEHDRDPESEARLEDCKRVVKAVESRRPPSVTHANLCALFSPFSRLSACRMMADVLHDHLHTAPALPHITQAITFSAAAAAPLASLPAAAATGPANTFHSGVVPPPAAPGVVSPLSLSEVRTSARDGLQLLVSSVDIITRDPSLDADDACTMYADLAKALGDGGSTAVWMEEMDRIDNEEPLPRDRMDLHAASAGRSPRSGVAALGGRASSLSPGDGLGVGVGFGLAAASSGSGGRSLARRPSLGASSAWGGQSVASHHTGRTRPAMQRAGSMAARSIGTRGTMSKVFSKGSTFLFSGMLGAGGSGSSESIAARLKLLSDTFAAIQRDPATVRTSLAFIASAFSARLPADMQDASLNAVLSGRYELSAEGRAAAAAAAAGAGRGRSGSRSRSPSRSRSGSRGRIMGGWTAERGIWT